MAAGYPFRSVQRVQELGIWESGALLGRKAKDEDIVPWCQTNDFVVVTCDDDFRSREMRQRLLTQNDVEVIWFSKQPRGVQEQTEWIVRHFPTWVETLQSEDRAYRQWMQRPNGRLKKMAR